MGQWPVAYRNAFARSFSPGGFQNLGGAMRPVGGIPASLAQMLNRFEQPANENWRRFGPAKAPPIYPPFGRRAAGALAKPAVQRMALAGLFRVVPRLIPIIGWMLLAYQLYEWWKEMNHKVGAVGGTDFPCPGPFNAPPVPRHFIRAGAHPCLNFQGINPTDTYANGVFGNIYTIYQSHYVSGAGVPHGDYLGAIQGSAPWTGLYQPIVMHSSVMPAPMQSPLTSLHPHMLPIYQPVGVPAPIPWPLLPHVGQDPFRDPTQQRQAGNSFPASVPEGSLSRARQLTSPRVNIAPEHRLERPPKRTKERKFIMSLDQQSLLGKVFNAITEADDVVDAFYWAIPKDAAKKAPRKFYKDPLGKWHVSQPTVTEKLKFVYDHFDKLDAVKLIKNLAKNEIGDRFGGFLGKTNAKINRKLPGAGQGPGTVINHASRGLDGPSPLDAVYKALHLN